MAVKSTPFVYDRGAKRWRKNGRWAKKPTKRQLRADAIGRPIDGNGRLVARSAIAGPIKKSVAKPKAALPKPASRPKKKAKAPLKLPPSKPAKKLSKARGKAGPPRQEKRQSIPKADAPKPAPRPKPKSKPKPKPRKQRPPPRVFKAPTYVPDGRAVSQRALLSSTFDNKRAPDNADEVLANTLVRTAARNRFSVYDTVLYKYGVQFINTFFQGRLDDTTPVVQRLAMMYPDFQFKFSADSIHVLLGSDAPKLVNQAIRHMGQFTGQLAEIYNTLAELWDGDIGWFVVAENDEFEGGS